MTKNELIAQIQAEFIEGRLKDNNDLSRTDDLRKNIVNKIFIPQYITYTDDGTINFECDLNDQLILIRLKPNGHAEIRYTKTAISQFIHIAEFITTYLQNQNKEKLEKIYFNMI